jgi:acyl phosphate:glycerol-3-phosphate acyltransferase
MATAGLYLALAYLLAAVPFGIVITTLYGGDLDIRAAGSGNIGGTNVTRLYGLRLGALVVALDMGKGLVPVAVGRWLWPELGGWWPSLVLFTCFLGHCFPIYLQFHGGKGVATAAGGLAALSPWVLFPSALVWLVVLKLSGRSSLAALTATGSLLGFAWWLDPPLLPTVALLCLAILFTHRANVGRLVHGAEPPLVNGSG